MLKTWSELFFNSFFIVAFFLFCNCKLNICGLGLLIRKNKIFGTFEIEMKT